MRVVTLLRLAPTIHCILTSNMIYSKQYLYHMRIRIWYVPYKRVWYKYAYGTEQPRENVDLQQFGYAWPRMAYLLMQLQAALIVIVVIGPILAIHNARLI